MKNALMVIIGIVLLGLAGWLFLSDDKKDVQVSVPGAVVEEIQTMPVNTESSSTVQVDERSTTNSKRVVFDITGKPYSFSKTELRVDKGDTVVINFENVEGFHDLVIDEFNVRTKQLNVGGKETIEFVADKSGVFEYYCSVGNHRSMGMVGKLTVQ
jgi:plastocyanin